VKIACSILVTSLLAACTDGDPPPVTDPTVSASSGGGGGAGGASAGGGGSGAGCLDSLPAEPPRTPLLSETGLYADIATRAVAPWVQPFAPRFELWSDTADKERWVYVPECALIDSSNMDDWSFPVGTRLWKSFARDGILIETRLVQRTGTGPHDWLMVAYVWRDDGTDADQVPFGLNNAKGTAHDVPDEAGCRQCHGAAEKEGGGRPSRALGFSALQLAHDGPGLTLDGLVAAGKLSHPPAAVAVPGDSIAVAALGSLHANCGHCHNASGEGVPQLDLDLWLPVGASSVETTPSYLTAVGQPTQGFAAPFIGGRIVAGDPAASAVFFRMGERGNNAQMPPLGTEMVDDEGLSAVEAWILSLP
jgi:mono/diheme cytochrome c family protein